MHSFKFVQPSDRALGCTALLDGRPLNCTSFTINVNVGQITELTFTIPVISADLDVAALDLNEAVKVDISEAATNEP